MPSISDQQLAHDLRDLLIRLRGQLRKQISNSWQLSVAEENVVKILVEQDVVSPSGLCLQLGISSQFMSQILNRLGNLGYISRKDSKTDGRKVLISLSKQGKLKVRQRIQQKEDWLASMISKKINRQEKEQLAQAMQLLARLYEDR